MIVKLFTHRYMVNIYDHLMPLNTFYNSIWHTYTHTHRYIHTLLSQYKTQARTYMHTYILIYSLPFPFLCAQYFFFFFFHFDYIHRRVHTTGWCMYHRLLESNMSIVMVPLLHLPFGQYTFSSDHFVDTYRITRRYKL